MVLERHPWKVSVEGFQARTDLRPEEGWIDMDVKFLVTDETVGAERTVFGVTVMPPGGRHDVHTHPHAEEVEYLLAGEGTARVGDVDVELRAGEVVFVAAGEAHGFANTSPTDPAVIAWCYGGAPSLERAGYVYTPSAARAKVKEHPRKVRAQEVDAAGRLLPPSGCLDVRVTWLVSDAAMGAERCAFGLTVLPPGARHEAHRHPHAEETNYLTAGEGVATVGGSEVRLRPGDALFIPRDQPHAFTCTSEREPAVLLWCFGGAAGLDGAGYVKVEAATRG